MAAEEEADELFVASHDEEHLLELVTRRVSGEPLAWIIGEIDFCGVRVLVHPGVYVPRWQSEQLVRRGAEHLREGGIAVDLCTGSGAIALALSVLAPRTEVLASEIDPVALDCARANGVTVFEGDLDAGIPRRYAGTVDLVIGVVPYVPSAELRLLPRDVVDYEPRLALEGGERGIEVLERALEAAGRLLRRGGLALFELGGDEGDAMAAQLGATGFSLAELLVDDEGDIRGIAAYRI